MEKIVSTRAVYIASTGHVTDSTETVCVIANLVSSDIYYYLLRLCFNLFNDFFYYVVAF